MKWILASERLPGKEAMYFCRHPDGVRMYIWRKDIYSGLEWLDEQAPDDDYWQKRCEAAEEVIELERYRTNPEREGFREKIESVYKEWQLLKSQTP